MRQYRVSIVRDSQIVFERVIRAIASEEAKDQLWNEYDPQRAVGLLDETYDTQVVKL